MESELKGLLWTTDEFGNIKLRKKDLVEPYKSIIRSVKKLLLIELGRDVLSIYLRGSVVLGNVIREVSDLDIIVILTKKTEESIEKIKEIEKKSNTITDFFCEISIVFFESDYFSEDKISFFSKFVMKTQSVCIFGKDISTHFPDIKLDNKVYSLDISYFKNKMQKCLDTINYTKPCELTKIKNECRHASKYVIRTIFAILASNKNIYTRDIRYCYKFISENSTYWAEKSYIFYIWVKNPIENKENLMAKLNSLIPELSLECETWLKKNLDTK